MRLRDVLYAAGLLGGLGALALAFNTHRNLSALNAARQVGGMEIARAAQAYEEFGQVQLLGFYALAILLFAIFLIAVFTRNETKRATNARSERVIATVPLAPPPEKTVEEPAATNSVTAVAAIEPSPTPELKIEPEVVVAVAAPQEAPASQETKV